MKKRITFQSSRLEEPLLAASEDILDVSEKLNAMLKTNTARDQQTEFTETLFEEDFQKMVIATSTVVRLGEEWFNLGDDDVVIGLIVPLAKKVRKSVLNYVPATKAAFSNSMDYLTKNAQAQSFRMVDKYTRALCAIVEILHRKRIRSSGISFGTIDAMDSDCVLLIKIANNLAAESRQIITLAQQGDPLEILTSSEGFLRAMEDFIDNISRYKLPVTKELVKRLRSQHQAIIVLSQDAKRMKEGSGQLSKDDIDERGASISTQVVNCTIELVLMIVMYYQKQWQDLIDAPIENTEDIESSENDSEGPRKPQKPNQSKVGKELPFFPTDSLGKRRSVRIDYERKYGLKPSYNSNSLAATVDSEKARLRKYSHSVSVVRDSEKEKGSQSPSDNQMKSSRAHTESSPLGKSEESSSLFRSKRSSEPAVQKMSLNPFKGKSKKKRRSASIRLRSNSDSVKKGEIISVHYVEATAEAEEKLNALFRDPTPFLSQEKSSPVEENSPRSNISKKRSKKRQMHGKSLPTKESTMYLRSAPSYLDAMDESCGGPQSVFRTTTTFVPKIERISSKKKLNKTGLFCDVSESDESQGSPKKSARRVTLEEPIHPKSKAAQRRSTIIVDPPELLPEEISPAETEHKKQIAMAAAMAASVPVVIDLFQKEFSWFSKEWDRLPMTSKTKFTTKMRNELIKMNNFVPPTIIEQSAQKHYIDSKSLKRQASFIPLNSLLSQIKEKKEQDDLEGMMVPLSSKVRWFHRSASLSNFLTKENAAKLQESQKLILEVVQACTNLIEDFINVKAPIREKPPKFLASKIVDIYKVLSSIVTLSTGSADNKIVRQMIVPTLDLISASPTQGTADDYLVNKLKSSNTYSQVLVTLTILRMNIYQKLQNIACMSAQVSHTINCVDYTLKKISHTNTLQLLSCTRAMTTTICEMLNVIETYSLIRFTFTEEKCGKLEKVKSVKGLNRIWTHKSSSDESISLCTLDYFITELTNPFNNTPERKEYELSFILTFQTTCSSQVLYEKLMNRYNVPDNIQASADEISATQKLVCHFILLWIQLQFSEISKVAIGQLLEKTKIFTKDGHTLLADSIERTIQQKLSEENRATSLSLKITPPDIQTLTCGMNLYQCFLQTSERKIAEQLTLMDFNIFKEIHHSELIDQAWIRNRHSAVHVMDHITRLNHVSYWVPSLILWSEKVKQRGEVLWKFIQIGQELLKLHNYNTLMGLVAGLNMSCITRLKHTTNMLPKNQIQIMQDLIHLFNPSRSFHVYRDHIEKAERPVIPYLGVYLTDLTLIDEIHSNKEDNLINFGKRRLIGDILQKILYFQEIPYDIEPDDFLSSYLRDLSFLDDEGLYQLSLTREPRNAEMFDIL